MNMIVLLFFVCLHGLGASRQLSILRQLNSQAPNKIQQFTDQLGKYVDLLLGEQLNNWDMYGKVKYFQQKLQLQAFLNESKLRGNMMHNYDATNSSSAYFPHTSNEPDLKMNALQMIQHRQFKAEAHQVITQDCYILEMHRILHPKLMDLKNKKPLLLQHGLMGTSADFLMNSIGGFVDDRDHRNLAFYLAKLGYDIWLGNSRGNVYSTNHTTLNPAKHKFYWQFSFDEMSKFDLPAMIAYIKNYTNTESIGYIGHSQGSLIMFQLLATQPKYANIIKPFIALAPVAKVNNIRTPIKFLAYNNQLMKYFLKNFDSYLNLKNHKPNILSHILCRDRFEFFCKNMLFFNWWF